MLKVFLVEDECVVREGLRDCIDWERYGFEFCGDAPDGELALPQIRKLRPDILITDIKMPFMDGLALSKLVCAELPETRIILISGHNDFEFAQEAIEIGVEQYLLKPVTKASLLKTLEDVSRKIDEEREQKAYLRQFQQEGQEYEQYARRKFFEQITSGTLRVSEIYEQAKKLQIDIDAEGYTVILLTLQSRGTAEYSQTLAERQRLVAVIDERGELFPPEGPLPPLERIGGVDKARAVQMALRTLAPQVILLDELGSLEETMALEQGFFSGVDFIASIHAPDAAQAQCRPQVQALLQRGMLRQLVILAGRETPGCIREVCAV